MSDTIDAIYENGVFRPLQPVDMAENQRVVVTIRTASDTSLHADLLHWGQQHVDPTITRERIKELLANVPGSFSDDIIAQRER